MRWDELFADLEAQLVEADAADVRAEVSDRTRREAAQVTLVARLRGVGASPVTLGTLAGEVAGGVVAAGNGWLLLREDSGGEALVPLSRVLWLRGLGRQSGPEPGGAAARLEARLTLGHALRALARDRAPVRVALEGGAVVAGTLARVGADWVDVVEHPAGESPRRGTVSATRTVPTASLVLVRSG